MKHSTLFFFIFVAGCTINSGIIPMDKDTYYISIQSPQVSFGPPVTQKADAYKEANEYCNKQNKSLKTVELKEVNQVFGRHGSASLTFRCISN
jgi:hypothetical protein